MRSIAGCSWAGAGVHGPPEADRHSGQTIAIGACCRCGGGTAPDVRSLGDDRARLGGDPPAHGGSFV